MSASIEMPRYRSHKIVHALEIARFEIGPEESAGLDRLEFVDTRYAPVEIAPAVTSRYKPERGDFFMVYDDGYQSISPRHAFINGYRKIDAKADDALIAAISGAIQDAQEMTGSSHVQGHWAREFLTQFRRRGYDVFGTGQG